MAALHGQQNSFYIPRSVEQEMSKHMFASLPMEACGVVLGEAAAGGIRISRFQPIRNVAPDPLHHFSLDDADWIRCVFNEPQLIGLFHSHPEPRPFLPTRICVTYRFSPDCSRYILSGRLILMLNHNQRCF
ncbi:Mov34/MPN/PAD-1 family protein [Paenibacillus sp. 1A_MP2]|uniref:Mov34/MPN/PAD-1 family protein n=1 Tax=Paenibacillus sp. 1A_MP2 TaxID=3457495 RepID=UPI003FCDCC5C